MFIVVVSLYCFAVGYNFYGTERMYSGTDGREMDVDIFIGVVYYQRLRHMVYDKYQVIDRPYILLSFLSRSQMSVRTYVRASVRHPKVFFNFNAIWHVGRSTSDARWYAA